MAEVILCQCGGQMSEGGKWRCDRCGTRLPAFEAEDAVDPVRFLERHFLVKDEETGMPRLIQLEPFQRTVLRSIYPPALKGLPAARNAFWGTVKKAGKSTILGGLAQWSAVRKHHAEVYILATTRDQARAVLYDKVAYSLETHPYWRQFAREVGNAIEIGKLGGVIRVVPNNWRAIEGFFPDAVFVDELHAFTVGNDRRAFDALVIPPQKQGVRWLTSYAGFEGESMLLEQYWKMAEAGERLDDELPIRLNKRASLWSFIDQGEAAWRMPWMQGETWEAYLAGLQADPSPTAFLRFAMNMWASSEQRFITPEQWDSLEVAEVGLKPPEEETRSFVLGLDAATKRDCAALVAASFNPEQERAEVIHSQIWTPPDRGEFDLREMGAAVVDLHRRYPGKLAKVVYDPYQMSVIAGVMAEAGVHVEEFTQTTRRTQADTNFRDLIVGKRLAHHGDETLATHVKNAVAVETSRGLRLAKEKTTLKIDGAVAASMALLAAMEDAVSDEIVVSKNIFYG